MDSPFDGQDEALVAALAKLGNEDAFSELVRRRQSIVRATLRRYCGNATLADDLAQTAFLTAWRDIKKLRDPRKFPGWLKRLVLNTWLQEVRRSKSFETDLADPEVAQDTAPSNDDQTDQFVDLERALQVLPHRARLCIVLAHYDGWSHQAIAERTGIPLGTVKSDIRRGLIELRDHLHDYAAD